jgi:hypothetical protein
VAQQVLPILKGNPCSAQPTPERVLQVTNAYLQQARSFPGVLLGGVVHGLNRLAARREHECRILSASRVDDRPAD